MFTEELPWLSAKDKELIMGRAPLCVARLEPAGMTATISSGSAARTHDERVGVNRGGGAPLVWFPKTRKVDRAGGRTGEERRTTASADALTRAADAGL